MLSTLKLRIENRSQNRLVPKSLLSIIISTVRNFFSYCQNVITLPISIYKTLSVYTISLVIFPLILIGSNLIWNEYPALTNLLHLISFFFRLGATYTQPNQVLISSVVNIGLIIVLVLPLGIFSMLYRMKGRVPKYFCFITTLCTDFLIHIVSLWTPSQIGTIVGLLINPKPGQSESTTIILLIFLLIFFIFLCTFFDVILFPQINFTQGRTIAWIGTANLIFYFYSSIILFLTRICEIVQNTTIIVILICVYSIIVILEMIFIYTFLPIIDLNMCSFFMGGSVASLFILVFLILKFYVKGVEDLMLIALFCLVLMSSVLVFKNLFKSKEIKIMTFLNYVYYDQVDFNKAFKSPLQFILYSRIGFKNAHPYILNFEVFDQAIEKWPSSRNVWYQYLRFLAIYYEKKSKLFEVLSQMKEQKFESAHLKGVRMLLTDIINSRKRHFSVDLRQKFKIIDEQIRATKNLLVIYWSSIEECSPSTAYDIGKQLNELIQNIETMFSHFDLLYPNNYSIPTKFGNFLSSVVFDPKSAEFWKNKSSQLKDQKHFILDMTQQFAFEMFPLLPKALYSQQVESTVQYADTSISITDNHLNETASALSMVDADMENPGYESSTIRQLGLKAPVPFICNLMISSVCFTIVCFLIGPFSLAFFVFDRASNMNPYLKGIAATCRIAELTESLSNYILVEGMKLEGAFSTNEDYFYNNLNLSQGSYYQLILDKISKITEEMHTFKKFTSTSLDVDSISSISLFLSPIFYVTHTYNENNQSLMPSNTRVTLNEGLTALIGDLTQYSPFYFETQISYWNNEWFVNSIKNVDTVVTSILDFVFYLCYDIRSLLINLKDDTLIFTIVFSIISLLFLPHQILMVLNIRKQRNSIIKIINSLPHIAIQKTISHFAHLKSLNNIEQNIKTETKYSNTLIKMISSRDVKTGLSIQFFICLMILHVILSIITFVSFYFVIYTITHKMIFVPYRLFLSENLMASFNQCAFLIMRSIAMSKGKNFNEDSRNSITETFHVTMKKTRESLNNFLFIDNPDYGTGILSSSSDLDSLFNRDNSWMDKEITSKIILQMPRIMMFDVIYEIINNLYLKITTFEYTTMYNENDENYILLTNFVLDHLLENSFKEINDNFENVMNSMISKQSCIIFAISIFIFFIGIIFLTIIVNQFLTILKTTRFVLSSISMIDAHFLTENSNILQLFSGNFDSSNIGKNSLLPSLIKTQEIVDDSILIINEDFCITSFNKAASVNFNLTNNLIRETRLDSILNFQNPKVLECATVMLLNDTTHDEFSGLKEATFDSRVASIDSPLPEFIQAVTLKLVNVNSITNQLVILIAKQDELEKKMKEINDINKNIEELKKSVIPEQLLEKVDLKQSFIKLTIKNAITVTFDCLYDDGENLRLNDPLMRVDMPDMKITFQFIHDALQELIIDFDDVCIIKDFGSQVAVCFNLIEQKYNVTECVSDAISFCSQFFDYCVECRIKTACGISYDILGYAGMISTNRLSFDYYGESRKISSKLASISKPYTILFDNDLVEFVEPNYKSKLEQVVISEDGQYNQYMSLANFQDY